MTRQCTASGNGWKCDKPHYANGLCASHRRQQRKGKALTKLRVMKTHGKARRYNPNDMSCDIPEGHQGCSLCSKVKPINEFPPNKPHCKECRNEGDLDRRRGRGTAEWKRKRFAQQGYVCGVCKTEDPGPKGWHTHHNPRYEGLTSLREVTCQNCNANTIAGFENSTNPKALMEWLLLNYEDITGQRLGVSFLLRLLLLLIHSRFHRKQVLAVGQQIEPKDNSSPTPQT